MDVADAGERIRPIIDDVRAEGAAAVLRWTEQLDGVRPASLRVPAERLAAAADALEPAVRAALLESIDRARRVHLDQRRVDVITIVVPGGTVTERWLPVDRVGLYVPGGRAVYPSSVIMNVVPAQVAGVAVAGRGVAAAARLRRLAAPDDPRRLLPPGRRRGLRGRRCPGRGHARLRRGPARGRRCAPVDLVTGPGNIYVTAAKRALQGVIGIDSEAGPTEVMILADDTADAAHVAADLISQAEHDVIAAAVLVTDSTDLADAVEAELVRQVADHQARRAHHRGPGRHAERDRPRRRPRGGPAHRRRLRCRAPRDPHA